MTRKKGLLKRISVLFAFTCTILQGCNNQTDVAQIKKIRVTYNKDNFTNIQTIDLENEIIRTKTLGEENTEEEEVFAADEDFIAFIKENILADAIEREKRNNDADAEEIVWNIKVYTEEEIYNIDGFSEEYPQYWDELLEYIEK